MLVRYEKAGGITLTAGVEYIRQQGTESEQEREGQSIWQGSRVVQSVKL